jgi:hypothetical protein
MAMSVHADCTVTSAKVTSAMTNVANSLSVKMEESEDEDLCITSIKIYDDAEMSNLPLKVALDLVLHNRSPAYIDALLRKLDQEGINEPRLLKQLSRKGIETSLGSKQNFNLGEIADVIGLQDAIYKSCRNNEGPKGGKKGHGKGKRNRDRSRSRSGELRRHPGICFRARDNDTGTCDRGPTCTFDHNPDRLAAYRKEKSAREVGQSLDTVTSGGKGGRKGEGGDNRQRFPELDRPPPPLWKALEEGDLDSCRRLLDDPTLDVDESYKFWTPLMKAAELGHAEIAQLLLDRGADISSTNRNGRDALSFAAAPSMKKASTDGHRYILRSLIERGADPLRKDERGQTARERAKQEGRDDIVKCLEELECGIGEFISDVVGSPLPAACAHLV